MKKALAGLLFFCFVFVLPFGSNLEAAKVGKGVTKLLFIKAGNNPLVEINLEYCKFSDRTATMLSLIMDCLKRNGYYLLANHEWLFFEGIGPKPTLPLFHFIISEIGPGGAMIFRPSDGPILFEHEKGVSFLEAFRLLNLK